MNQSDHPDREVEHPSPPSAGAMDAPIPDPNGARPSPRPSLVPPPPPFLGQGLLGPRVLVIPGLAHTCLFFALAIIVLLVGELLTIAIGRRLPAFRHEDFNTLAGDARLMIPAQAMQYAVLLALTMLIFGALWHQPFWRAIHWNVAAVSRRWLPLVGLGILLGLGSGIGGNYLPMPKEAPILNDLMHSTTGAWMMFVFGTTGAPLLEELAFRGFLLPSLINAFLWLDERRPDRGQSAPSPGWPLLRASVSVLLTSLPFAFLHSLQVSYAWAPVLLIGIVSVALCIIRLQWKSLAASTLVHATYNFCLFAGMLVASDGFRHLEKLSS